MTKVILALDVLSAAEAVRIAEAAAPHIDAIKIGYPLVLAEDLGIAGVLEDLELPLIADFKVADIPNTSRLIAEQVFSAGFSAIIAQGFVGRDSVRACVDAAHSAGGECYVVAEMSHPGATEFFHNGMAERIAGMAIEEGADGIIAPATRPERVALLRDIVGGAKILSPGIGAQGGDPEEIVHLIDGMIIGRAIYEAEDPASAAAAYGRFRR